MVRITYQMLSNPLPRMVLLLAVITLEYELHCFFSLSDTIGTEPGVPAYLPCPGHGACGRLVYSKWSWLLLLVKSPSYRLSEQTHPCTIKPMQSYLPVHSCKTKQISKMDIPSAFRGIKTNTSPVKWPDKETNRPPCII